MSDKSKAAETEKVGAAGARLQVGQKIWAPAWDMMGIYEWTVTRVGKVTFAAEGAGGSASSQRYAWVDKEGAPHGWRTSRDALILAQRALWRRHVDGDREEGARSAVVARFWETLPLGNGEEYAVDLVNKADHNALRDAFDALKAAIREVRRRRGRDFIRNECAYGKLLDAIDRDHAKPLSDVADHAVESVAALDAARETIERLRAELSRRVAEEVHRG